MYPGGLRSHEASKLAATKAAVRLRGLRRLSRAEAAGMTRALVRRAPPASISEAGAAGIEARASGVYPAIVDGGATRPGPSPSSAPLWRSRRGEATLQRPRRTLA